MKHKYPKIRLYSGDPGRAYQAISPEALRTAKKCPKRCSWTRWKMELSRRRMERDCPDAYHLLPDPDRIGN